jgi:hypothetical protein
MGSMKQFFRHALVSAAATLMTTHASLAEAPSYPLLIVIGKLKNQTYENVWDPDDMLGHMWVTGTLRVSRVVKGKIAKQVVRVRYFTHAELREDRNFRFRLIPAKDVDYLICAQPGSSGVKCD